MTQAESGENSLPASIILIPGKNIPIQVPTKTIRINPDAQNDPNITEKSV